MFGSQPRPALPNPLGTGPNVQATLVSDGLEEALARSGDEAPSPARPRLRGRGQSLGFGIRPDLHLGFSAVHFCRVASCRALTLSEPYNPTPPKVV